MSLYLPAFLRGGCSSVGRAAVCGTAGRGFKSRHSPHLFARCSFPSLYSVFPIHAPRIHFLPNCRNELPSFVFPIDCIPVATSYLLLCVRVTIFANTAVFQGLERVSDEKLVSHFP
jgi:hypothetical protein